MTSHIIAFNAGWVPLSRLSLQLGFNYVLSNVRTPASDYTASVLKTENDYWTLNFNTGIVLDNKTDLNLGYFYYQPDNLQNNYAAGLPLGAAAQEHGVTASLTRRISDHLRLNLRYAFTHLEDFTSGGFNNFQAQLVSSSLQYPFLSVAGCNRPLAAGGSSQSRQGAAPCARGSALKPVGAHGVTPPAPPASTDALLPACQRTHWGLTFASLWKKLSSWVRAARGLPPGCTRRGPI